MSIKIYESSETSYCTIEVKEAEEELLPEEAKIKLAEIMEAINVKTIHRVIFDGEIRLADYEYGQTCISFVGSLKEQEMSTALATTAGPNTSIGGTPSKANFLRAATKRAKKVGNQLKVIKVRRMAVTNSALGLTIVLTFAYTRTFVTYY
jgi:hypothetical protein